MLFCGNLGDPIYNPQFHEISEYFFDVENLCVTTNGMHNIDFWARVLETWPESGLIRLSIDGLKDTNHIYRVNSKWDKIEKLFELIATTKRKCKIEWKYIAFEHNYADIDNAISLSKKLGINSFNIQQSRRIGEEMSLNGKIKPHSAGLFKHIDYRDKLDPFCNTGDMHYINAAGQYSPCCWWPDFDRGEWSEYNITDFTLEELEIEFNNFSKQLLSKEFNKTPKVCRTFCKESCNDIDTEIPNTQKNRIIINNDQTS